MTTIVCAAVRFGNVILCGPRHWDPVMRSQSRAMGGVKVLRQKGKEEQGFVDQYGEFHDRREAMEIVKQDGQPFDQVRNGGLDYLFSEGLY